MYFKHYHSNKNRIRTQETRKNRTQNLDNGGKLSANDFGKLIESDEELSSMSLSITIMMLPDLLKFLIYFDVRTTQIYVLIFTLSTANGTCTNDMAF